MLIGCGCLNSTEAVRQHFHLDSTDLDARWWKGFAASRLTPVGGSDPRIGTGWVELEEQKRELAEAEEHQRGEEASVRHLATVREEEDMADAKKLRAWARNMLAEEEAEESRLRASQREFQDEVWMRDAAEIAESAHGDQGGAEENPGQGHEDPEIGVGQDDQCAEPPALLSPLPARRPVKKGKARAIVPHSCSPPVGNHSNDDDEEDEEDDDDDQQNKIADLTRLLH